MSSLTERMLKNSAKDVDSSMLENSIIFNDTNTISRTKLPILNIALLGDIVGGLPSGLVTVAGPSKHFKSNLSLLMVGAYLKKYPDAICVFYDNEFGINKAMFRAMDIDISRIVHVPIKNVENLKFDMIKKLNDIERSDHVVFLLDSMGNLASVKEMEDAENEKSVADMSRAKSFKSFYRMITPYLTIKDIPFIQIAHVYDTQEFISKTVISGGTGQQYSSNIQFIVGRQQVKDSAKKLEGYDFVINIEKSRYVREKEKFVFQATFKDGINPYSGLLDVACDLGFVLRPTKQKYQVNLIDDSGESKTLEREWGRKETDCAAFWGPLLKSENFRQAIRDRYQIRPIDPAKQTESFDEVENELDG